MDISTQLTALEQRAFATYVPSEEVMAEIATICEAIPQDNPSKPRLLNLYILLCARKALDSFIASLEGEINIFETRRNRDILAYVLNISWIIAPNGYTADFVELLDAVGKCFLSATRAQVLSTSLEQIQHGAYQIEANLIANLEEQRNTTQQTATTERNSVIASLYTKEAHIIDRQIEAITERITRLAETIITTLLARNVPSAELKHILEMCVRTPQCAETTLFTHSLYDLGYILNFTKLDEETYEMNFTPRS